MHVEKCDLPREAQNIETIQRVKLIKDPSAKKERPAPFEKLRIADTAVELKRPIMG